MHGHTFSFMHSLKTSKRPGGMRCRPDSSCRCTGREFSINRISATRDRSFLSHWGASPSEIAHTLLQTPCTRQWQCLSNSLQHIRPETGPWFALPLVIHQDAVLKAVSLLDVLLPQCGSAKADLYVDAYLQGIHLSKCGAQMGQAGEQCCSYSNFICCRSIGGQNFPLHSAPPVSCRHCME